MRDASAWVIRNSRFLFMFTGIIEELGRVRAVEMRGDDARIVIEAQVVTSDAHDGDSIAVNGV